MRLSPETALSIIPSVGNKRKNYFKKLDIEKIQDLLLFFPRRYHDLRNFKKISQLVPGEIVSVTGKVLVREEKKIRKRLSYLKIAVSDGTGVLYLVFFNQAYLMDTFVPDAEFFLNGKAEVFRGKWEMINPVYEEKREKRRDLLLPVYPLTKGINQMYMRRLVKFILQNMEEYPAESLSFKRRQELHLPNIRYALSNIHFPRSDIDLEKARNYLIFDEFLRLQLTLLSKKKKNQNVRIDGENICLEEGLIKKFETLLPFKLTSGQKKIMEEVLSDISKGKIIQRLVQGEVGSGKTVIAIFVLWLFAVKGYQCVFLNPTEILAEQHFLNWQEFFLKQNISVSLLIGQLPKKEKDAITERMKEGEETVIIGTHALLSEKIIFKNLKVVVVDEQHKFGVKQREILKQKGDKPHYLIMSATPIPRSIALTFYGSLDFSIVGELPKGERRVATYLFPKEEKEKIYRFLKQQVLLKKQGFIVTPSIKGNENIESAIEEYELIKKKLPALPVGLLHGKIPHEESEKIMGKFRKGEILLLVATTVIESGIDVPAASYIIIEQAERFGLAQLHQLRGRVGRSGETGYCFLIYRSGEENALERLETFLEAESAMEIAEIDLKLRGQGDLLGTRQHGIPAFRIGNIITDMKLLNMAREEAEIILKEQIR